MKQNMNLVPQLTPPPTFKEVQLILREAITGLEWELVATDGNTTAVIAGIRADGTLVRYLTQSAQLQTLGFQVNDRGVIKEYGHE
jgi:endonuclease/exonuclease/phosphatase (EEP) superfamily protein YafD